MGESGSRKGKPLASFHGAAVTPDPKPVKRHKASRQEWEEIRLEKGTGCRVCLHSRYELHHLVGRDLGGSDVADNIVPLCSHHHRLVEERRLFLGDLLLDAEIRYVRTVKGERFLSRYYGLEEAA